MHGKASVTRISCTLLHSPCSVKYDVHSFAAEYYKYLPEYR